MFGYSKVRREMRALAVQTYKDTIKCMEIRDRILKQQEQERDERLATMIAEKIKGGLLCQGN